MLKKNYFLYLKKILNLFLINRFTEKQNYDRIVDKRRWTRHFGLLSTSAESFFEYVLESSIFGIEQFISTLGH